MARSDCSIPTPPKNGFVSTSLKTKHWRLRLYDHRPIDYFETFNPIPEIASWQVVYTQKVDFNN